MSIAHTQHTFAGGQLDRDLLGGRQDLARYFTGAHQISNYVVRRQGCLAKRPGTDLCADLLSFGLALTDSARIIPFVFEKSGGFCLIFSGGKAYVASGTGLLHTFSASVALAQTLVAPTPAAPPSDYAAAANVDYGSPAWATYTRTVGGVSKTYDFLCTVKTEAGRTYSRTGTETATGSAYRQTSSSVLSFATLTDLLTNVAVTGPFQEADLSWTEIVSPDTSNWTSSIVRTVSTTTWTLFSMDIPYGDDDLADLSYCQSGDTLFLAHRGHPPITIVRLATGLFEVRAQTFVANIDSPAITSLTMTGASNTAVTGPNVTVNYALTAVKDGRESQLGESFFMIIRYPWVSGGIVTVQAARPAESLGIEHYNVYKKTGATWGYIGKMSTANVLVPSTAQTPSSASAAANSSLPGVWFASSLATLLARQTVADICKDSTNTYCRLVPDAGSTKIRITLSALRSLSKIRIYFSGAKYTLTSGGPPGYVQDRYYVTFSSLFNKITVQPIAGAVNGTAKSFTAIPPLMDTAAATRPDKYANMDVTYSVDTTNADLAKRIIAARVMQPHSTTTYEGNYFPLAYDYYDLDVASIFPKDTALAAPETGEPRYYQADKIDISFINTVTGTDYPAPVVYVKKIKLYTANDAALEFIDDYVTPDVSIQPPTDAKVFSQEGDYPGLVALYQQRLVYASTANEPAKYWMSATGNFEDFIASATVTDASPIEATLPLVRTPRIFSIVQHGDLHMFCESDEWVVKPSSGPSLTYRTISAQMQSASGSARNLKPIVCSSAILFAEASGRSVREYAYDYSKGGFVGRDVSVVSASLFAGRSIKAWAYQQHPDSILWCVMSDGALLGFTYMPEHEVFAWFTASSTGATFISAAGTEALAGYDGKTDTSEVFLLARRNSRYYVERLRPDPADQTLVSRALHLDCARYFTAAAGNTIPAGFLAVNAATGASATSLSAGTAYVTGVRIAAALTTVHPEFPNTGTIQNVVKAVVSVAVRVRAAASLLMRLAFQTSAKDVAVRNLAPTLSAGTEATVTLASGDFEVMPAQQNSTDGRVTITDSSLFGSVIHSITTRLSIQPTDGAKG